ncbi:copper-binding protein [Escherichia coli]|nr:copper-binding protein [Escherichia coli]
MRNVFAAVVIALFFSFSASAADMAMLYPAARTAVEIHSQGVVKSWDERKVSIAHQASPAHSWPPRTMSLLIPSAPSFAGLPVGTEVDFSFLPIDGGYQLIAIAAARP